VFQERVWDVHTPDLIDRGAAKAQGDRLAGVSLKRYMRQIGRYLRRFAALSPRLARVSEAG
jgi:hypothetical protein